MSLFRKGKDMEDVPTIEVAGEEATIPQPALEPEGTGPKDEQARKVKFPKKIWGRR
jgi:hypothetical protein